MPSAGPRTWISRYYPSLNGLRGVAILMVFITHYGTMVLPPKRVEVLWTGVDLFFVLSGFLITGILYDARFESAYFRNFYVRRALRIFPLYYSFFLAVFLLTPVLHLRYDRALWSNLLYLENFTVLHWQRSNPAVIHIGHLRPFLAVGALWSLCVEEQFYLTWPFVVRFVRSRTALMRLCVGGVVATLLLRIFLLLHAPGKVFETHFLYFSPYTRCDSLLVGAWLALWLRGTRLTRKKLHTIAYLLFGAGVLPVLGGLLTFGRRWPLNEVNPVYCTYGYTCFAVAAAGVLMLALDEASWLSRLLRNRQLAYLGAISYGFYFLHAIPWEFFHAIALGGFRHAGSVAVLAAFCFTLLAASLSYRYLESPFLRWKDRLAPPSSHRSTPSGQEMVAAD